MTLNSSMEGPINYMIQWL